MVYGLPPGRPVGYALVPRLRLGFHPASPGPRPGLFLLLPDPRPRRQTCSASACLACKRELRNIHLFGFRCHAHLRLLEAEPPCPAAARQPLPPPTHFISTFFWGTCTAPSLRPTRPVSYKPRRPGFRVIRGTRTTDIHLPLTTPRSLARGPPRPTTTPDPPSRHPPSPFHPERYVWIPRCGLHWRIRPSPAAAAAIWRLLPPVCPPSSPPQ